VKTWYFGVSKDNLLVRNVQGNTLCEFNDGFIVTDMNGTPFDSILSEVSDYLLSHDDAFTNDPTYFLTVSKDPRGNYTQELKNLFGKTEATRAIVAGNEIISRYYYDVLGNLLTEEAPKPTNTIADTRYTYNTLGQLIKKTTSDGGTFGFAYTPVMDLFFRTV